ncbi:hypothetical protein Tco_1447735 [Tanacetum coccineum]
MENSKRRTIPMQEKLKFSKSQGASTPAEIQRMQNIQYASAVGSIMYDVRCTRPDVAFAQNITRHTLQEQVEAILGNKGRLFATTAKGKAICSNSALNPRGNEMILSQATQTVFTHNAAYQANDLDAYDSDCDELNTAKVCSQDEFISYGSDDTCREIMTKDLVPQTELSAEQAFWSQNSVNSPEPTLSSRPTKVKVPKELSKVSMVNTSLKKLKYHLAGFDVVVKERTTTTTITEGS